MHLAIYVILVVLGAGLGCQLIAALVPAGPPRLVMLVAVAAGAGVLLFNRIALASPSAWQDVEARHAIHHSALRRGELTV